MQNSHFEEEVHLRDYIKVLHRRWKLVLFTFLAIVLATSLYTLGMKPVYQADTLLKVSDRAGAQGILGELAAVTQSSNPVETEMEILKSRSLGAEVVRRLALDVSVSKTRTGAARRILRRFGLLPADDMNVPEVEILDMPGELLGKPLLLEIGEDSGSFRLLDKRNVLIEGRAGGVAEKGNIRLKVVFDKPVPPKSEYYVIRIDIRQATENLLEAVKVSQVGRNSQIVRVSYQDVDPARAALVLETLQQAYIERDIGEASREATVTLDFIEQQRTLARDRLEGAQEALDDYKVRTGAVALSQEAQLLVQRISDMEVEANQLLITRKGMDRLVESLGTEAAISHGGTEALGFQSPEFGDLISGYLELQRKRADLLKEYTTDHPVIKSLDGQVLLVADQIRATAAAIKGAMRNREGAIKDVLDSYREKLDTLPDMERQLAKLAKDVLIQEKIYSFLLEKEQEVRIVKASTVSQIRVVDPAAVPLNPVKPKSRRNILLGLVLGLMLGMGLAFFIEYLDDSVRDAEELESRVGVPVYGTIPFVRKAFERRKEKKPHLVIEEMYAPVTEAFRTLRTNIFFARGGERIRTLAVTSPEPGAGKSFVVANLAALSTLLGKKTLVIDADMRHPQQHIVLGVEQKPGLSEVLVDRMTFQDAIKKDHIKNLRVLTSGKIPPNPAELLGSPAMKELLDELREHYDLVIIDTPPVNLVADALLLTRMADFTLMVARSAVSSGKEIERALSQLATMDVKNYGMILNAVRRVEMGYSGKYYRYGGEK
ncbi:MAG: polysaccharide biosynthesis tyrosine autokinase [bacterium]|nr:polysaccharide biosynthesis tyrosine autokinase [bacterium]